MSMFLNFSQGSMGSAGLAVDNDMRGQPADWQMPWENAGTFEALAPFADAVLWPRARLMGGDPTQPVVPFGEDPCMAGRYGPPRAPEGGGQQMLKITGTTRDSSGNPLGNCLVQAFLTLTDVFVGQVTSDAGGYFTISSPYPSLQHYLVSYKAGSPDQAGSSVNTLVAS